MRNFFQLKSFWNFLQRNRLFTAINIFGFAVSLMFVVLIGLYVQQELAVNTKQLYRERIYRIVGSSTSNFAPFTGADLMTRYPEIERSTCIAYRDGWEIEVESETSSTSDCYRGTGMFTDSSFFRIFSFPFVEGTPDQALQTKGEVVLTESYARRLFGDRPALGRTISNKNLGELVVSGVVRDFGKETHFTNPDFILWLDNLSEYFGMDLCRETGWCGSDVYFLTHSGTDLPAKTADLDQYLHSNQRYWLFIRDSTNHPGFERLEEVYLSPKSSLSDTVRSNDSRFLMVLGITALVILFFAVINYINLSVAQSGFRAKEAATRRLLGGSRGSLFGGFVLESIIICFASLVLGLLAAATFEPWFCEMMRTDISIAESLT
ncbi:MAG: ABC transporter permease, partial [Rikenella sp.]|nr:ABC transporter permease [Rikenella sp.]